MGVADTAVTTLVVLCRPSQRHLAKYKQRSVGMIASPARGVGRGEGDMYSIVSRRVNYPFITSASLERGQSLFCYCIQRCVLHARSSGARLCSCETLRACRCRGNLTREASLFHMARLCGGEIADWIWLVCRRLATPLFESTARMSARAHFE